MIIFCHAINKCFCSTATNCPMRKIALLHRCLSSSPAAGRTRHTARAHTQYSFVHSATSWRSQPHFASISKLRTTVGHCGRDTSCGFAISGKRLRSSHAPVRWSACAPADTLQIAVLLCSVLCLATYGPVVLVWVCLCVCVSCAFLCKDLDQGCEVIAVCRSRPN